LRVRSVASGVPDRPTLPLVRWDEGSELGVDVAVTTRHGGASASPYDTLNLGLHVADDPGIVVRNRRTAAAAFGVDLDHMVFAHQVHGATTTFVGLRDRGRGTLSEHDAVPDTDALVTTSAGVTLAILVADCLPLALVDPDAGVLAAVHAGWRGTAAGVVGRAIGAMRDRGAHPGRLRAFLGPAVHPDRYQVSDEVPAAFSDAVRPAVLDPAVARFDGPGHWLVDLVAANRQQLMEAGVADQHIVGSGTTTADDFFFSDRAQRPCGRFALVARLLG
jgi:polyphenol oxidase